MEGAAQARQAAAASGTVSDDMGLLLVLTVVGLATVALVPIAFRDRAPR